MRFRPCIDIHNGTVKQIVGGSLRDQGDFARENFVSDMEAAQYARLYLSLGLTGGHVILLNPVTSAQYEATKREAMRALRETPGALQLGGGITPENAASFLDAGASHVIVTSYVFREGKVDFDRLAAMTSAVGRERLVLDLSCRRRKDPSGDDRYYIVTDRWQKETEVPVTHETMDLLSSYCSEFLIHAADVEGKANGPELTLASLLGSWDGLPVTYAGGVGSLDDLEALKEAGQDKLDVTIGSALDLFGGTLSFADVLAYLRS